MANSTAPAHKGRRKAKQAAEDDPLHTTAEAADYLGLAAQTLHNWRSTGNPKGPKFVRVGRSIRYRQSALDACLTPGK